jgi:hypothetical protein
VVAWPRRLVFAAARGREETSTGLELRNGSSRSVRVTAIEVVAPGGGFRLADVPTLPVAVTPGGSLAMVVRFLPAPGAPLGVHRAQVRFRTDGSSEPATAALSGLFFAAPRSSEDEPPLQAVLDALGLAVDVGGPQQNLGAAAAPIGEEVSIPLFQRAGPEPIQLIPLACFAVKGLAFGYYLPGGAGPLATGRFEIGQNKHLRPRLDGGSTTEPHLPEQQPFGLWLQGANRSLTFFTEDRRNTDRAHRARVYPFRLAGAAAPEPHAYLVAFENWVNWDYQDAVFVLWNVAPAGP